MEVGLFICDILLFAVLKMETKETFRTEGFPFLYKDSFVVLLTTK